MRFTRILFRNHSASLQHYRWRKFQSVLKKSPFYRPFILNDSSLVNLPIIDKKIFMSNFDKINTIGIELSEALRIATRAENERDFAPMIDGITVGLSSGTIGNRGVFLASKKERVQWVACILDRVVGFSFKRRKVAFFLRANSNLYSSVQSKLLMFQFFDLLEPLEVLLEKVQKYQPDILVGQPSLLIEIARKKEIGKLTISPKKIISVAEVLTPEDRDFIQRIFQQTIHQVYQCTEGLLATTCKNGVLHFNEDYLIIEKQYLDQSKTRFHPIITDLKRSSQPIVRYELNDIIHEKKTCSCGSKFLAIDSIEGRSDDILVFNSIDGAQVKIFPDFFRKAIILADQRIIDYTVVQISTKKLSVFVGNNKELEDKCLISINQLLEKFRVESIEIEFVKEKLHEKATKLRRIRNESK
ncbi:MAG: adenylate synthase [Bacteroidetes bacterium]|nr:adenylate synthase [Bacteroidota bacterium]